MSNKPLSKDIMTEYNKAVQIVESFEDKISDRMNHIFDVLMTAFGEIYEGGWHFDEPGEYGSWDRVREDIKKGREINFCVPKVKGKIKDWSEIQIIDKNNKKWDFSGGSFPSRWLFEVFEQEIIDGKKKYDEQEQEKIKEKLTKKQEAEKLSEKAKSKLSEEEIKALIESAKEELQAIKEQM